MILNYDFNKTDYEFKILKNFQLWSPIFRNIFTHKYILGIRYSQVVNIYNSIRFNNLIKNYIEVC